MGSRRLQIDFLCRQQKVYYQITPKEAGVGNQANPPPPFSRQIDTTCCCILRGDVKTPAVFTTCISALSGRGNAKSQAGLKPSDKRSSARSPMQ